MAIAITASYANRLSWSANFGPAGECVLVLERWVTSGQYRNVSASITAGSLPMTLLASYQAYDEALVAIWGAIVTPALAGTSYSVTRTPAGEVSSDRFDVLTLSGVSTDMVLAKHEYRTNVSSATSYSHIIATKYGGMVIDYVQPMSGVASANVGQNYCISSSYLTSYKSGIDSGTTAMGWTWQASRAVYACVSLRPKIIDGGILGIL